MSHVVHYPLIECAFLYCLSVGLTSCVKRQTLKADRPRLADIDCSAEPSYSDTNRYIAHAAGGIDGHIYTNSLDSLNNSYKNGFRLFEIDLISTRDNHLVGAHSWEGEGSWAARTGSSVEVPTLEEFKSRLIDYRFRPLDFAEINNFYSENADAILVTDKTQDYEYLARSYVDPQRLLVEVFDEKGLQEAIRSGIQFPMPSFAYDAKEIRRLHNAYGLKFFALHHLTTDDLGTQMLNLRSDGICIFAYTSNEKDHMARQFQNGLFGFYTDFYAPDKQAFSCEESACKSY